MILIATPTQYIFKRKKKKESNLFCGGFKRSQVFLKKYYPTGWRFFKNPEGLNFTF
jgi:hypothetical protein